MIHHWMEEQFDTLVSIGMMVGLIICFLCYWNGKYQQSCVEVIIQEFLERVSTDGRITTEEYEQMRSNIDKIGTSYEVEISCVTYALQPVYGSIPEESLKQYYMNRNNRRSIVFQTYEGSAENMETARLQKETNASILAAEQEEYISLPKDGEIFRVEAVRKVQEVYEGEELITLCCVYSSEGNYYVAAEPCYAEKSGLMNLEIRINDEMVKVPIEIICYPLVSDGIPEEIVCNVTTLTKETGKRLTGEELWIEAVYPDGTQERITPESEEWQDDYDENYCGIQPVTIRYRNMETVLLVVSENSLCKQCGSGCNERSYTDYQSFPYCVTCMSQTSLFTGKTIEEETLILNRELISLLDREGEVSLEYGDMVTVKVVNNRKYCGLWNKTVKRKGR